MPTPPEDTPSQQTPTPAHSHPHQAAPTPLRPRHPVHPAAYATLAEDPATYGACARVVWSDDEDNDPTWTA